MKLFKNTELMPIPAVVDKELPGAVLCEYTEDNTNIVSTETLSAGGETPPCGSGRSSCKFSFHRQTQPGNGSTFIWTFHIPQGADMGVCNSLIAKLCIVGPADIVHIYGPADLNFDNSEIIAAAMSACSAKEIIYTAPFITSLHALYVATCATHITVSPYMMCLLSYPPLFAGGSSTDVRAGVNYEHTRRVQMIDALIATGLITSDDKTHLIERQGRIALFGTTLLERLAAFNKKHEQE